MGYSSQHTQKKQQKRIKLVFYPSHSLIHSVNFPSTYFVPALLFKVWTERPVVSLFFESAHSPSPNLRDFETHTCEVQTLSGCHPSRLCSSSTTRALSLCITSQPVPYVIPYLMGAINGKEHSSQLSPGPTVEKDTGKGKSCGKIPPHLS